jgi:monothiol glutaredoxin
MNVSEKIKAFIDNNRVMLFMKGTKDQPMCGFSAQVVQILRQEGVDFECFNVLEDMDIREGIKDFSNWPTIPQLYIEGKFIGGCDITMQLHRSGDLKRILTTGS